MIIEIPESATKQERDILTKFTPLSDRVPGESWILLYYGPSGSGKTWFCGTAGPRTLFINTGMGLETLLSPAFRAAYPESKDMIVRDITEGDNSAIGFDAVSDTIQVAMKHFPDKFDTVVLDDATFWRRLALNKAMELNEMARGTKRGISVSEYDKAEVGDYGQEMSMIEWFLATFIPIFKTEGKNFVMTAHVRETFRKAEKIGADPILAKSRPAFTGKTFPDQIPAYFDDVFYAETVGAAGAHQYRCRTDGNEIETAKARHNGIFGTTEPNPNFQKMLTRIKAGQLKQR